MFKTAKALVASRRLGLVSVWHPSAFLRLLDFMAEHASELASDARLRESLAARRFREVWPRLRFVSCWDAAFAASDAQKVREAFPGVDFENAALIVNGKIAAPDTIVRDGDAVTLRQIPADLTDTPWWVSTFFIPFGFIIQPAEQAYKAREEAERARNGANA